MNESTPIPMDEMAERSVLGHILTSDDFPEELSKLKEDHFSIRKHKIIWKVISETSSGNVNLISVSSKIKDLGLLDEIGGAGYISSLISQCFYSMDHFHILEEKRKLRKIVDISSILSSEAYKNLNSSEILKSLQDSIFDIEDISQDGNILEKSCANVVSNLERKILGEKITGLKTSIVPWDISLGGLTSRFYVIAARAGKGKTAMAEQIISRLLQDGKPCLIFEKDMSSEMFITRMACRMSDVSFTRYDLGYCKHEEYLAIKKAISFIRSSPFYLYSPSNLTADDVLSIVKREKQRNGIECVFLDHVLNLDVGNDFRIGLTIASKKLRALVENNNIPLVTLAQLNRGAHNLERPTPANIKEFDALYADCDVMIMLWSEKDVHEIPQGQCYPMKFLVNKNRYGAEFEEDIGFDRPLIKFINPK